MSLFHYKVVDLAGGTREGEIEASALASVVTQLQDAGYVPIRVDPVGERPRHGGWWEWLHAPRTQLTRRDVEVFTQQLAILLGAGLPLDHALQLLAETGESESLKRFVVEVRTSVQEGASFFSALHTQEGPLSEVYLSLVRAGEAAGELEVALTRLAEYLQRLRELRESIFSALIYPFILFAVAGVSVVILLAFVVPQFAQLFQDSGVVLPMPTRVVMELGEFLRSYGWLLPFVAVISGAYVVRLLADPFKRLRWDRAVLRFPLVGDLVTKVEIARLSRTLGVQLSNAVPLLSALGNAKNTLRNRALAEAVALARERVQGGQRLAEPLAASGVFPPLAVQMMRVGEESGQLSQMLVRIADVYDQQVKISVQRLLNLLEPTLIVGLGIVIAAIIMSIMMAIVGANQMVF